MAQRKPPSGGKPAAKKGTSRPAGRPGTASSAKATATTPRKAPPRKPGRSIVNQRQTPWGVIWSVVGIVVFAAAVVVAVVATRGSGNSSAGAQCSGANSRYCLPELPAAKQIPGVTYRKTPQHTHQLHTVNYDASPPIGGDHSPYWADCSGTVYSAPIANENAVHALEHGAVWVTYRQGLPSSQVATLADDVKGQDHVLMSPYPNLKTPVSLQAWGYQLFVNKVNDPRIGQFIGALKANPAITPEVDNSGKPISCANPQFKQHPSTFGHPLFAPAAGGGGTTMGSSTP